jgi:hypothetical protein
VTQNEPPALNRLARFSVLTRCALAFVVFIVGNLLKSLGIDSVVYHPFHILRAEQLAPRFEKPAEAGWVQIPGDRPSRKTAGLATLRESGVNAALHLKPDRATGPDDILSG